MKKLVCELCESTNMVKENGLYVCQSCGTQYTVEEARKLMIEGTVNVQGVVQVDTSSQLENYYLNARRAMSQQDWSDVAKYYDLVLQNEPNSIEAIFYSAYGRVNLSLYDADINKRRQIFNVLINNTLLIAKVYSADNRESCIRMIEMINNDIIQITDSSFVYNATKNQYGMTLFTDAGETRRLFNALRHAFIDSLERIMEADPQEWICNLIISHVTIMLQLDAANKKLYDEKLRRANAWLAKKEIGEKIEADAQLCAEYNRYTAEFEEMTRKYHVLKAEVEKCANGSVNQKLIKKSVDELNVHVREMETKKKEIVKFLSLHNIEGKTSIAVPEKMKVEHIDAYRNLRVNIPGVISFVLGMVALVTVCTYGLGIILAVIGLIIAIIALLIPRKNRGFAIAGAISNATVLIVVITGILLLYFLYRAETQDSFSSRLQNYGNGINYSVQEELNKVCESDEDYCVS